MRFYHRCSPFGLLDISFVFLYFCIHQTISFNISYRYHYNPLAVKVKPVPPPKSTTCIFNILEKKIMGVETTPLPGQQRAFCQGRRQRRGSLARKRLSLNAKQQIHQKTCYYPNR